MRLNELKNTNMLARPEGNRRNVSDGVYSGRTTFAELVERESNFSKDGFRVVLNIKVEVEDENGETIDLYISPNYTWSPKGNMVKILEKLDALPKPGESISLDDLVGVPVQVVVENVEKDGETYSNIVSIKKVKEKSTAKRPQIKVSRKRPEQSKISELESDMFEDELEDEQVQDVDDIDIDDIFEDDEE